MGVGGLKGRLPRTKTLILIGINVVPTASLAPDKGAWYSLTNLGIFKRPLKHSFRVFFSFPGCLCVQIAMLDRQALFVSPSFLHSPSQFSHPTHSLRGTQSYSLPLPPLVWKEAQPHRQLFLGRKPTLVKAKANLIFLADKRPTTHFTFVVTCLFRHQL